MLVSASVGVVDSIVVKSISAEVHPFEIVFFRNLFSLMALAALLRGGEFALAGGGLWPVHIARAVLKLAALAAAFLAVTMLPLATVTAIAFTTPVFTVLGAILILGEAPRTLRLAALVLGFAGVLVVVRPWETGISGSVGTGFALAIGAAVALAAVMLLLKVSSHREDGRRVVWINLVLSVPLCLLLAIPVWTWPSPGALALMAAQGIGGLVAQLAVTRAMRIGDASLLVVVDFVRLPLAILAGLVLFSEPFDFAVAAGGGLILGAVLLIAADRPRRLPPMPPPGPPSV
ncbi:DMT family transporter [Methylobrevis sp. L22]|uniref:DMT family transporter n=2 Tax=Methylobrevis albus TaxID=2793297 RepID=A0A931I4W7_9HYPH|nr:DMT family transporter [Methylobrevis albus]MBH0239609.1 DMT family transporter [Methylobrevis albus]